MKTRASRYGCLAGGVLLLLLILAGGAWWYLRQQTMLADAAPDSPVLVFLISPSSGEEFELGAYVPVAVQAAAPSVITSVELFVDGQSLGAVTDAPEDASWTWQALTAGVHTFHAKAVTEDGEVGQSQTVIVNVFSGGGAIQVPANEGQTLPQVGAGFGVPPDLMSDANPQVDPAQPLPGGFPVHVPVGEESAEGPGPGGESGPGSGGFPILFIQWKFIPKEPVDQSYCYLSSGDGTWEKMPKNPFEFFKGAQVDYPQYGFELNGDVGEIRVQCWAWLGGVLKFLGEGEAQFDIQQPPEELVVNGAGFQLIGMPQFQPKEEQFIGGNIAIIPPPFAMREPSNTQECTQHFGNILAGFVCDALLNAPVKQFVILQWEWEPKVNWPGYETWFNAIDGYRIYEIDPLSQQEKYLKEIKDPGQKVTAVPLPWGAKCYGVRAYTNDPAIESSEMTTYCPGSPPTPQVMTLSSSDWITTGGQWIQDGDCDTYGTGDAYLLANQNSGFGNQGGQVLVGSYVVDDDEEDCFRQGDYSAAVKFDHPVLPAGAVVQRALLKFSALFTDYKASGVATNFKEFCVGGLGKSKQDWSGLDGGNHFLNKNVLFSAAYNSPIASVSAWTSTPEMDVTSAVKGWLKNPATNHGFILTPRSAPSPATDGSGTCETGVGNIQLEIHFFVRP